MKAPSASANKVSNGSMQILQNRWYNELTAQLGLNRATFQIGVPWSPIAQSDQAFWEFQNVIPPCSLLFDRTRPANSFFAQYAGVASQMSLAADELQHKIGPEQYSEWLAFVSWQVPPPPDNQLPAFFLQWAMVWAPEIAQVGASSLSREILIRGAEKAILPYLGPQARVPDFLGSYQQLRRILGSSSARSVFFRSDQASSTVSDTWTRGDGSGPCGLWAGSPADSQLSEKFCQSLVTVRVRCKSFALVPVSPGSWYNSALLQLAYRDSTSPPWPSAPKPTWVALFGPEGAMQRMLASLVPVDGTQATLISDTCYSMAEQESIRSHLGLGLWPFYAPDSTAVHNRVTFNHQGAMCVTTNTDSENPLFIGAHVLSMSQYLGHAGSEE